MSTRSDFTSARYRSAPQVSEMDNRNPMQQNTNTHTKYRTIATLFLIGELESWNWCSSNLKLAPTQG
ncbi:MAG: hypothetical protein NTY42_05630 [Planctomycetota bacterium]|nr:hypothetical protein [Planctomycetota bacterium]